MSDFSTMPQQGKGTKSTATILAEQRAQAEAATKAANGGALSAVATSTKKRNDDYIRARYGGGDGWNDTADEASGRVIRGNLLKFTDGIWSTDKGTTRIAEGTEFVAVDILAAWVKWKDQKPVEYKFRQPGQRMPEREELGDTHEGAWETSSRGEPIDPWQNTRFLYLMKPATAETVTFSTSSYGGRGACIDLADTIARIRANGYPHAVPVVALGDGPMKTQHGVKRRPVFRVVRWVSGEPTAPQQLIEPHKQIEQPRVIEPPTLRDEMNDELPL